MILLNKLCIIRGLCKTQYFNLSPKLVKNLFGYVAIAFNRIDGERLKLVGPDRLCAEWVLKNGGAVSFTSVPGKYLRDYNALPPENVKLHIKEIDGSNSSIMAIGFEHLKNCRHIDVIILHNCKHLENDGLKGLVNVKETLSKLQVSGCYNINDLGMLDLKELTNLKKLKIFDMPYVKNIENVAAELKKSIPNCEVAMEP